MGGHSLPDLIGAFTNLCWGHSCDVTGFILKGQGVYGPRSHDETFGPIRCYRVDSVQGCQNQFLEGHLIRVESKLCRAVALQELEFDTPGAEYLESNTFSFNYKQHTIKCLKTLHAL